jgi:hypothetical protein
MVFLYFPDKTYVLLLIQKKGVCMKSVAWGIVAICLISSVAMAHRDCGEKSGWAILVKDGVFYPQESILRSIFERNGSNSVLNWFEGIVRYQFCRHWALEASGSYAEHKGIALCGDECTKVQLPTFGLGLKCFFGCCDRIQFFLGAGLRLFCYREFDDSPYVAPCIKENVVGGMVNSGVEVTICRGFLIDIFLDYNFKQLKAKCDPCYPNPRCPIELGGLVAGLGIGYKF